MPAVKTLLSALAILGLAHTAPAQVPSSPAFEVASIKQNKDDRPKGMGFKMLPGGRLSAIGLPLYVIVAMAYDLPFQSTRLSGGPDWIRSERYDIEAKIEKDAIPEGASPKAQNAIMRQMLQGLLAERFKLKIRIDTKEMPVYAAVVGKRGPKLEKSKTDEKDCGEGTSGPGNGVGCHSFAGGQGRGLHGQAVDISDLVLFVSNWSDRPVVDRTGLKGLFNIQTEGWASLLARVGEGGNEGKGEGVADANRPTLFGVFDQLGLKLEAQKAPIEMFVIEHVERPSEN